ncbi:MAG TPA: hypothetical protein VF649_01425 [Sphingomonas sp.]|jgi:FkbH-like protein|uniref:hypothetical protein n=1 Tax=Sphingomonas sp. TaxID=28214 RepID=UPI002EDB2338
MKMDVLVAGDALPADADRIDLARQALAHHDPIAFNALLAEIRVGREFWSAEVGQTLVLALLETVLDALGNGNAPLAINLVDACTPALAEESHGLLLLAVFPDGHVGNLAKLGDAALLCLTLLTHKMGHRTRAAELLEKMFDRAPAVDMHVDMHSAARDLADHFAASADTRMKAKLVIWGLDDTFRTGALADGGDRSLHMGRATLVRALNRHGIVSALCGPGDADAARRILDQHGLWDEFVFPRISPDPIGKAVCRLIEDMLLQPANVLFIDGDTSRLAEVAAAAPGIHAVAADACDALLQGILDTSPTIGNRVAEYRILEARVTDRQSLSDADFLLQSGIQATYTHRMDNLAFVGRIEELINRADPLNYTETRVVPGTLRDVVMNVSDYDVFSAFIWDKYGHHGLDGLVGTVVYHRPSRRPIHLAFSCRIMHMGVEDFLMSALAERYGQIDLSALAKPLPSQSAAAITYVPFEQVRDQVLATHAPRDGANIRIRVMSDCMSGGFHHYSRFKDEMDFDNIPRVFSLPAMLTGAYREQIFPEFLVYNPAIDYMEPRWTSVMDVIDPAIYEAAHRAFCGMVIDSDRKLLLLLSPENASDRFYAILPHMTGAALKARDTRFNQLWRDAAARNPDRISVVELSDFVTEADMLTHAYHYSPSILKHMTEIVDGWFMAGGRLPA